MPQSSSRSHFYEKKNQSNLVYAHRILDTPASGKHYSIAMAARVIRL